MIRGLTWLLILLTAIPPELPAQRVYGGGQIQGGGQIKVSPPGVYADAVNGNDANAGTFEQPVKTLAQALVLERAHSGTPVILRAGTYYPPDNGLSITSQDSGSTWSAYTDPNTAIMEQVEISGGLNVTAANGFTWTDIGAWGGAGQDEWTVDVTECNDPCLHPDATHVRRFDQAYYQKSGNTDGVRVPFAYTTNGTYLRHKANCFATSQGADSILLTSSITGCAAGHYEAWDRFKFQGTDVLNTYHGIGLGDIEIEVVEKFVFSRKRLLSASGGVAILTKAIDSTIGGDGDHGFVCEASTVANSCDPANGAGNQGHRYRIGNCLPGSTGCIAKANALHTFYYDRCPGCASSVTTPAATGTIHYFADAGENPNTDKFIIPQCCTLSGSDRSALVYMKLNAANVSFYGIQFKYSNYMIDQNGDDGFQGMVNIPRSAAVDVEVSSNISFDRCVFAHTGGHGIQWRTMPGQPNQAPASGSVTYSLIYDTGGFGMKVGEGAVKDDPQSAMPGPFLFQNNEIYAVQRYNMTGIGGLIWIGNAHDGKILNSKLHDAYQGGISVGKRLARTFSAAPSWTYNWEIGYNEIYGIGHGVTDDEGAIYLSSALSAGCPALPTACIWIHDNKMHDITHAWADLDGYGGNGIYPDKGASNIISERNLVYRVSQSGIFQNNPGKATDTDNYSLNNTYRNNIIAYFGTTASLNTDRKREAMRTRGGGPNALFADHNIFYANGASTDSCSGSPTFQSCYQWSTVDCNGVTVPPTQNFSLQCNTYFDATSTPLLFVTTVPTTLSNACHPSNTSFTYTLYPTLATWQSATGEDQGSTNTNPGFVNPLCSLSTPAACWADASQDNYNFSGSPPTGFTALNYSAMGRTSTPIGSAPTVAFTFPVNELNPSTQY